MFCPFSDFETGFKIIYYAIFIKVKIVNNLEIIALFIPNSKGFKKKVS